MLDWPRNRKCALEYMGEKMMSESRATVSTMHTNTPAPARALGMIFFSNVGVKYVCTPNTPETKCVTKLIIVTARIAYVVPHMPRSLSEEQYSSTASFSNSCGCVEHWTRSLPRIPGPQDRYVVHADSPNQQKSSWISVFSTSSAEPEKPGRAVNNWHRNETLSKNRAPACRPRVMATLGRERGLKQDERGPLRVGGRGACEWSRSGVATKASRSLSGSQPPTVQTGSRACRSTR
jgi:hypothetical protein